MRVAVGHAEERDEEPRRPVVLRFGSRDVSGNGFGEVREVQLAAGPDHRPDVRLADRDLLEARAGAPQARQLQVDEERVEARERLAVRVRKAEAVDRELEGEGIDADLADRELALVILVGELLGLGTG